MHVRRIAETKVWDEFKNKMSGLILSEQILQCWIEKSITDSNASVNSVAARNNKNKILFFSNLARFPESFAVKV